MRNKALMIKGLNSLQIKLEKLKKIDVKPIIENASARVRDEARKKVKADTGELQNSITYAVKEKGSLVQGTIFSNKEYALYVEMGTGPVGEANHSGISPDSKPMYTPHGWVYFSNELERFVYTKGQPARPFLYPALHDNRDKISKFIMNQIKKKLKEV